MPAIQIGDRAPDFTVTAHDGRRVALADFRGKQTVVLFFYPRDHSLVCTREACSFRDAYEDFVEAGAAVIGVSGDGDASHQAFAQLHRLPFLLVSDVDDSLRKAFEVPKTLGMLPGRVTYVIDREGVVRNVVESALNARRHMEEALQTVRELSWKKSAAET